MREREETIFLVSLILFYPIPKDTTSSALLCLQCFGSFHVILLSRHQHYTELTYVFPEPLIHSPKSIRYSLCPRKSILELHSMQIPLFLFFFFPYNPQLSISVTFLCRFPCHSLSFSFFFFPRTPSLPQIVPSHSKKHRPQSDTYSRTKFKQV